MNQLIGTILVLPAFLLILSVPLFPIYIGFTQHDWVPFIIVWGTAVLIGAAEYGLKLLKKDDIG